MLYVGAIIALGLLIVVHEAGHYFVARWCKMRVDRFSLGFGPAIWSKQIGDTQFQLAPIPFGGFVQISGMLVADEVEPDDERAYPNRPAWQRFATIFAGPATNYLFAVVLACVLYAIAGIPGPASGLVAAVVDGSAAHEACGHFASEFGEPSPEQSCEKLQAGDRIIQADDTVIYNGPDTAHGKELIGVVESSQGQALQLTVDRNGKQLRFQIAPKPAVEELDKPYRLGLLLSATRADVGLFTAIGHALYYPVRQTQFIIHSLKLIVTGQVKGDLTGPVGIASGIKSSMENGWQEMLQLLMLLNVYLGLFNLFPLPALDGGRLVFLGYEMATRRRANPKIEATVHMVGIMALLVIMVLVTYKDIARFM